MVQCDLSYKSLPRKLHTQTDISIVYFCMIFLRKGIGNIARVLKFYYCSVKGFLTN